MEKRKYNRVQERKIESVREFNLRDREIVRHMAEGLTIREAADLVGTSYRNAESRLVILRDAYEAKNTTHLVTKMILNREIKPNT